MLILEGVRQFMGHDHALVGKRAPVRDVKFSGLRIVEPFDLFGEHVHHEIVEVESFGKKAKGFGAALVGIAFGGILFFVHLLDDIGADFFARTERFFERRNQFQARDLAHLAENFVGSSNEVGIRGGPGIRGRRSDGSFLGADGDGAKEKG